MALFVNFLQVQLEFGKLVFVKEGGGGGELDDPEKNLRRDDEN